MTEQPPAVPLPGPNVTPEPNEKSRVWQAIVPGTQTKPQDTLRIRKTPWHGVTEQPPAVPLPGPNVTPEPNEKSRVWQAIVPGTQIKPQDTLRIRKTPWHGVTEQRPAALPGPNVTPEPNEKIKVLAGIPLLQAQSSIVPGTEHQRHFGLGSRQAIPLLQAQSSTVPGTETCAPSTKNTSGWDL